jgi:hypothetical protein
MSVRFMHPHADRGDDLYESPPCAVHAIMREGILTHRIWECAAGNGAIVTPLRDAGHVVFASDKIHRTFPLDRECDFLKETKAPAGTEMIVTNPPYSHATEFVEHALELCPRVLMLLRLSFLESRRRSHLFKSRKLVTVYQFIERLPMMHRDGWTGRRATSSVAYAWFYFDRRNAAAASIEHISIHDGEDAS